MIRMEAALRGAGVPVEFVLFDTPGDVADASRSGAWDVAILAIEPARAQTIAFEDFVACKGEHGAKEAGKMRAEGKDYVVKDGDVLNFLFNV